ncbi:MAG: CHASE2 domain-containing protein [Candidatus Omnitrophica bacterium]|nr:CHASE2 domain-containing protein [Candidatus Omnitrophota bacterium]
MSKTLLKSVLGALAILGTAALLVGGSWFHVFEKNELDSLDLRFRLRPAIARTDKVVIVEIDNDTIRKLGQFPFHRGYHAKLIDALSAAGAKAVVFDIFFSEPRSGDKDLLDAMRAAGNVYLPYVFELGRENGREAARAVKYSAGNLPEFVSAAKGTGYINVMADADGKFRRLPPYIQYEGQSYPAISFLVSGDYLGADLRKRKVPLDENGDLIVNFAGKWTDSFRHYSFGDILQSSEAQARGKKALLDLGIFKDRICLVGYTADGTTDLHPSPLEPLYPSIGIHADVINSVLHKKFITRAARWVNLVILLGLSFLILVCALKATPLQAFGILVEINAVFALVAVMLFNRLGIWIDGFYPFLVMVLLYLLCTLYRSILHFRERITLESELKIARQIQESFVPKVLPEIKGFDIAATMLTAREVGGDLYNVIKFNEDKVGVMAGDVMGKGIPASLFMAMAASSFKFFAKPELQPEQTLFALNEKIIQETPSYRFVTLYYSVFGLKSRTMFYANGGHLPVLYLARDQKAVALDVDEGLPVGMMSGPYSGRQIKFDRGDIFIYYTDGIIEAVNAKKEMYGVERLSAFVENNRSLTAQELCDGIVRDVMLFLGKRDQQDDITLVVMKFRD